MSNLSVHTFCKYIDQNIIPDNTIFTQVDDIDMSCIVLAKAPDMSIRNFIKGIFESTIINSDHFEEVILYVVNILNYLKTKGIYLNNLTSHRLILILLLLASKITDDEPYCNSAWSIFTGIELKDLNNMELTILKLFNFNLFIVISPQKALSICKGIY